MKGLKLGILMLAVVGAVTFGGYGAMAMTQAPQPYDVTQKISELLAQIKWLQEELLRLQNNINDNDDLSIMRTVSVGSEFSLAQNQTVAISGHSGVTLKNVGQMVCLANTGVTYGYNPQIVAPCGPAYSILVREPGKTDKTVSVTSVKTKITDKLNMSYLHIEYDHESNTPVFKLTNIATPPPARNLPPVISGVSGPTTLKINETGTFSVNAYDPENKTLYYLIKWGDEPRYFALDYQGAMAEASHTTQQSTYTHSYANSGTYTINVEVSDEVGNTARSSLTVKVTNETANKIKVISPNGGEVVYAGTYATIYWEKVSEPVSVALQPEYNCPSDMYCAMIMPAEIVLSNYEDADRNWFVWYVNGGYYYDHYGSYRYVPDGQYKVKVCGLNTGICDYSDGPFTVVSGRG